MIQISDYILAEAEKYTVIVHHNENVRLGDEPLEAKFCRDEDNKVHIEILTDKEVIRVGDILNEKIASFIGREIYIGYIADGELEGTELRISNA